VIYKGAKPRSADDRYRLLKVVIRDNETRGTILKNAHMLKDWSKAVHKKVGIGKNLTRTQHEHNIRYSVKSWIRWKRISPIRSGL